MNDGLAGFRRRVDDCDAQIIRLINQRLKICQEVGDFKAERGLEISIPDREREVISKALGLNDGPCPPEALEKIFRLLIDTAVSLEEAGEAAHPES